MSLAPAKPKRQQHPNSLANLRPPWKSGDVMNRGGDRGPLITPYLRRLARLEPAKFMRQSLDKLSVAENIAWVMLYMATQQEGDKARTEVLNRLDGMQKGDITINAGEGSDVKVALLWADGSQA